MVSTSLIQIPIFSICNMSHLNLSFGSSPEMKQQRRCNRDNVKDKVTNVKDNHDQQEQEQEETLTDWE